MTGSPPPVRQGAAAALRELRTPGDVRLLIAMLGWAAVLPILKYTIPLPRLVALAAAGTKGRERSSDKERRAKMFARWIYRSRREAPRDNCLERSLTLFRFLGRAGACPRLVVGVGREDAVTGHVWVLVDGEPVADSVEHVSGFARLVEFDERGRGTTTDGTPIERSDARTAPPRS